MKKKEKRNRDDDASGVATTPSYESHEEEEDESSDSVNASAVPKDNKIAPTNQQRSKSFKFYLKALVGFVFLVIICVVTKGVLSFDKQATESAESTSPVSSENESSRNNETKQVLPPPDFYVPETITDSPTALPTESRTKIPTGIPSPDPTNEPSTISPTATPTVEPTTKPTTGPTLGPTAGPSREPIPEWITYRPGNLTTTRAGLLLSEGLSARLIATSDEKVSYHNGEESQESFHGRPDAGETFTDTRPENPGGWIYVSNSEMEDHGKGGVGAITFDRHGRVIDYKMILEDTTMNCGGGPTPWGTWVSCEELEFDGVIYQVDPTGEREPEVLTMSTRGGRWESFAYDVRNRNRPRFFATEDHNRGAVRRFTPDNPNWDRPWDMLHGNGRTENLILHPVAGQDGGTFEWSRDLSLARVNAATYYPQTEGIDCHDDQLFFVCKNIRQIFTLNLDDGTYTNATTLTGLFDGKPDQMQRILDDPRSILYFTEEGGRDAGVHARDLTGGYYTILEGPAYHDETTGLAFSPDGKHMYIAFQDNGKLFDVWRKDGEPFHAQRLDVKYHASRFAR